MKLFPRLILAPSLIALTMLTGCPDKPVPPSNTGQLGDQCDAEHDCMPGLLCENGICRKVCHDNSDCPNDSSCLDERCVKNTTPRQKDGESCNSQLLCENGLECLDGICQKPCNNNDDCKNGEVCQNGKCIKEEKLPERGQACNQQGKCAAGLTCINNVCQKSCNLDSDCADEELICEQKICVNKPTTPPTPSEREGAQPLQGGILTPVAGEVTNSRYKVHVMGGAMQGEIKNEQNSARLESGAWKKEE